MRIYKEFFFEAAHFLPSADPSHPNARVHGHSFRARITVDGQPDEDTGIIIHFGELERITMWLWDRLHNRLPGLVEIVVARDSCHEGCVYHGPPMRLAAE
jgi:6-pyruvoyltetrahydropterin/6-carboxytetrahydropterin synthase